MATTPSIEQLITSSNRVLRHLVSAKTAPLGLTRDEFQVLAALDGPPPMSLGQLTRKMRFDNPAMSRLVHRLAERGFLTLDAGPGNGRRLRIQISSAGQRLIAKIEVAPVLAYQEDQLLLQGLLTKYLAGLDTKAAKDLPGASLRATA